MAYMKSDTLISSPVESAFGISEALGGVLDMFKSAGSSVLDFYGTSLKAQGAAATLTEIEKTRAATVSAPAARGGGIPTTYLVIGGLALAGVLVFAMRRK
jgi:hypothetical protein